MNPDQLDNRIPSAFASILQRLVEASPGALGAVLADEEGETVDLFGDVETEEMMLAAAYMGIWLNRTAAMSFIAQSGPVKELRIRGKRLQYIGRLLGLGYQVTVVLEPTATLPKLAEALEQATAELRVEAGGVFD